MNYENLKKIGYFNVANDIMMKRMAIEIDTDSLENNESSNLSNILLTLNKLKEQVSGIPDFDFKKMAIEENILEIEEAIKDLM
jgi:uncharacterized protein HemX